MNTWRMENAANLIITRKVLFQGARTFSSKGFQGPVFGFHKRAHSTTFTPSWQISKLSHVSILISFLWCDWFYAGFFNVIDHEIEKSKLDRKIKTWLFTFLNMHVSLIKQDKILISQLSVPKFRYFADQNGQKGDPWKLILTISEYKNEIPKQLGLEKQTKKMG